MLIVLSAARDYAIIKSMKAVNVKKMVFLAICLSVSLVLSYIESILPFNIGIPGAKLGLANIVTIIILLNGGAVPAVIVTLLRIMLSGFMFGNLFSIIYSMGGAVLSLAAMAGAKRTLRFGVTGISTLGGIMHNMGQLIVAAAVTNKYVFTYFPMLFISGILAGIAIGVTGGVLMKRISPLLKKQFAGM